MVEIKVNSDESYLLKDILEWSKENYGKDNDATGIFDKYFSEGLKYDVSSEIYYFVEYMSMLESYKAHGRMSGWGYWLHVDTNKSPRKKSKSN